MKNLESFTIAMILIGMFLMLGSVMKEVAESGPAVRATVSQLVRR
jgi:hypothetical protein